MAVTTGLIQGPGKLYVAAVGTTLPTTSDLADLEGGTLAGWSFLGRTTEAVTITDEPSMVEARSQQTSRVLAHAISQWDTTVATTLRDLDLSQLARLLHGTAAGSTVTPGSRGAAAELSFAIVGPWDGGSCLIVIERGTVENGLELPFDNEEFSTVPLSIKVMEGDTIAEGYEITILVA